MGSIGLFVYWFDTVTTIIKECVECVEKAI